MGYLAKEFGARLHALRAERKWSYRDLAARAALTPGYLHHLEHARNSPSLETVFALAAAFDVPVADLLGLDAEGKAYIHDYSI